MKQITAVLNPDPDGTLHLPLPVEWQGRPIRVNAELVPVGGDDKPAAALRGFGCLKGQMVMALDFDEPLEDFRDYTA
ncbi:DUF2281 domain-containing protein [Luteolibacter flavescens]|uniref:DUF2281 domain-containing protein n=1 Tax=Luteolibacter flavescens TaxID=1859460 RepID=A0ABT3FK40_9BACT|nr:DUF2281 domain-containing protein [Luteolibacter flavescens]MCW1883724.1 DUF2281 domain-containing protein [Luteolibacter flavescens]